MRGGLRGPWVRHVIVLAMDGAIAAASFWLAMLLRFEGSIPGNYLVVTGPVATLLVCCRLLSNMQLRVHRWSFRLSGLTDGVRIGVAGVAGTGLLMTLLFLLQVRGIPRSVIVLELLMTTLCMAALRFSPRLAGLYVTGWARTRDKAASRTVILGAGAGGDILLRDLQRSEDHKFHVVGFLDDNPSKWGMILGGKQVLGPISDLPKLARQHAIDQVLIAIPRLEGKRVREILALCADLKLRFKILPVSFVRMQERSARAMMQDLSPDDLLMREPVTFAESGIDLRGRVALVTGAAGSIGSEICRQLLRAGLERLVLCDLNENELYLLSHRFSREHPQARLVLQVADIRDAGRMRALFEQYRPHDVFHAAAHKHVPLMEAAPCEAVKNNVLGTRNVAEAAHRAGAERLLYISTDKAVRPTSVMGATKRVGETVIRCLARRSGTRFCAVRFGNVLGSAGSVVPLFREQIAAGGPVRVTDPEVRRFFMTVSEAVALVLESAYQDVGELAVLDMGEPIRIVDLARQMITMAGLIPEVDIPITFTGLRPGEKLYEELMTEEEERTRQVHRKILAADVPAPAADFEHGVRELERAAAAEDAGAVVRWLERLVPSYSPSPDLDEAEWRELAMRAAGGS